MIEAVTRIASMDFRNVPKASIYSPLFKLFKEQILAFVISVQKGTDNNKELYTDLRRDAAMSGCSVSQYIILDEVLNKYLASLKK